MNPLKALVDAINNLAAAIREANGTYRLRPLVAPIEKPKDGALSVFTDEDAHQNAINELVEGLEGSPRAMQAELLRSVGYDIEDESR